MNVFEKAVAFVSPSWGRSRLRLRAESEAIEHALRSFDAASMGRRAKNWRPTAADANTVQAPALDMIRRRSRDLCRNNEYAARGKNLLAAYMVGTGVTPRFKTDSKRQKQRMKDAWSWFNEKAVAGGECDFYGLQGLCAKEVFEAGEVYLRWHYRPSHWGLKVPLQVEVLPAEYLDTAKSQILANGNECINGVEFDGFGRRVAYWFYPRHPGEMLNFSKQLTSTSVRVSADDVDFVYRLDRAGQVRGVPWLAPAAMRLRDVADFEEAHLLRKKIEACLSVFIKRNSVDQLPALAGAATSRDERNRQIERIAPGMIHYLDQGEEVETLDPGRSDGYADYLVAQLRATAVGIGLTYDQLTGDLRQANYSSSRKGMLDFWAQLDTWQWHMLAPQLLAPAARRVLRAASVNLGGIPAEAPVDWTFPKRLWLDPRKDVEAEVAAVRAGLQTWDEAVAERGYDPDEQAAAIAERNTFFDENKITVEADARTPRGQGTLHLTQE